MAFYRRVFPAIQGLCPFLLETQAADLALLIGAILSKRTLCLTALAACSPVPLERRTAAPKHELLHRLKRLSRFLGNGRVDPVAVQLACIPAILARLGHPRWVGLVVDWTSLDTTLPRLAGGGSPKYQVLTVGVPRRGRVLPLLTVVYERDKLPAAGSQNRWEEEAPAHVLAALPAGVRPVVIGDRGFGRAESIQWLQARRVDDVLRLKRGAQITEADGARWKLGAEGLERGRTRWVPGCATARTTTGRATCGSTWPAPGWPPSASAAARQGRSTRSPGTWPPASATAPARWRGTARGCGWRRRSATSTPRSASKTPWSPRPTGSGAWPRRSASPSLGCTCWPCPGSAPCRAAGRHRSSTRGRASLVALALALLDHRRDFPPRALPRPPLKAA